MPLMETLYHIAPEIRVLVEAEEFEPEKLDALVMKFEEKAKGLVHFMGELESFETLAKAEINRIKDRMDAVKNRKERLKQYLKASMETAELYELKLGTKKVKIQNSPPKVIIDAEDKVPAKFKTVVTTVKIDKKEIVKELKKDKKVNGCHLEQDTHLRIR